MEQETKTVIVLGMHRSGTSMISGILSLLGVNMGKRSIKPKIANVKGYFEDVDFLSLNKKIFAAHNASWRKPPTKLKSDPLLTGKASILIKQKSKGLWGWKDPRTVFTIGYYLPCLINPFFIFTHRNPDKVAESLHKIDGTPMEETLRLAKQYEKRIERIVVETMSFPQLFVNMETVLQSPSSEISRIRDFLGIKTTEKQYEDAVSFVLSPQKIEEIRKSLKLKTAPIRFIKKIIPNRVKMYLRNFIEENKDI